MADSPPLREPTFFLLTALLPGPLHGYGIIKAVEEMSDGRVRLRAGTLYAALERLENAGFDRARPRGDRGRPAAPLLPPHAGRRRVARGPRAGDSPTTRSSWRRTPAREDQPGVISYECLLRGVGRLVSARDPHHGEEIVATARAAGLEQTASARLAELASLVAFALRPARPRRRLAPRRDPGRAARAARQATPLALVTPFLLLALGVLDARLGGGGDAVLALAADDSRRQRRDRSAGRRVVHGTGRALAADADRARRRDTRHPRVDPPRGRAVAQGRQSQISSAAWMRQRCSVSVPNSCSGWMRSTLKLASDSRLPMSAA